jgi:hypothetical protein
MPSVHGPDACPLLEIELIINPQPDQSLVTSAATEENAFERMIKPTLRFFAFSAPLRFSVNSAKKELHWPPAGG